MLRNHLLHYPYENIEALLAKMNSHSQRAARMMFARGKRATPLSALGHGLWTFIRIYVIRRGFLDGRQGPIVACNRRGGQLLPLAVKLMALQRESARRGRWPCGSATRVSNLLRFTEKNVRTLRTLACAVKARCTSAW